ncbi:hypothetical protein IOK49_03455 [Fervidicoccus fontis]|jgi:hypothetical protein|uniref:Uncharacterized protein n=3 Tax=Fervidicoccus fontis TaxID=683846 RepID=I0A0L6_FERFK|nr:hypothetical protein [Fervidicoccus fontis]AFH42523.1 hypothetical protein FFONT_0533 [Fervidicoccus fontis Kam940]MBE9391135.1 hypothetical protein [Fervidicoccus fontis]
MKAYKVYSVIILLIVIISPFIIVSSQSSEDVIGTNSTITQLLGEIVYLYDHGVNVSQLVNKLNYAVKLEQEGNITASSLIISQLQENISALMPSAESNYYKIIALKIIEIILLLSIPVLTYVFLPRIYLSIWYRSRRKWLVKKK